MLDLLVLVYTEEYQTVDNNEHGKLDALEHLVKAAMPLDQMLPMDQLQSIIIYKIQIYYIKKYNFLYLIDILIYFRADTLQ